MKPRTLHRLARLLLGASTLLAWTSHGQGRIYLCVDPAGRTVYTDRGCPQGEVYAPEHAPAVAFAPLTAQEKALLEALDAPRVSGGERRRSRGTAAGAADAVSARAAACERVESQLDVLRETRRKGYPVSAAQAMDQQEADLKAQRRALC